MRNVREIGVLSIVLMSVGAAMVSRSTPRYHPLEASIASSIRGGQNPCPDHVFVMPQLGDPGKECVGGCYGPFYSCEYYSGTSAVCPESAQTQWTGQYKCQDIVWPEGQSPNGLEYCNESNPAFCWVMRNCQSFEGFGCVSVGDPGPGDCAFADCESGTGYMYP